MSMRSGSLAATVTRSFALDDIRRDKSGDGRTVTAYAAVFDAPVEIRDQDGHYREQVARSAFNRTLSHRGTAFGVFYNHGRTLYGTPSDRAAVPLGTPVEIKPDGRGLLTVTRYNKTPLADDILESIDNGDIRGQSFTGRMRRSTPERGPFRSRGGELTLVTRQEIELVEYGPTPFPAYETAEIMGRRASDLSDADSALLQLILANLAEGDAALDPIVAALTKTDQALDKALAVLSDLVGIPNPDSDAGEDDDAGLADPADPADDLGRSAYFTRLRSLAGRLDEIHRSGTSDPDRASADANVANESDAHSAPKLTRAQIRARLYRKGVL